MSKMPPEIAEFLAGERFAVAGVSRQPNQPANAIYRKLRGAGLDVLAVNPKATEVEGIRCYPNLASIPGPIDRVVAITPLGAGRELIRQCAEKGVSKVWFHRSFGAGSVSGDAVQECRERNIGCIIGGCPMMYCEPVDVAHRCIRWWLRLMGRVPG